MNAHMILVTFLGPTNSRGSRIKLTSQRFENRDSVTIDFDHRYSNTFNQAADWLSNHGYTTLASGESSNGYIFAVMEFVPLKEADASKPADLACETWKAGSGRHVYKLAEIKNGTGFDRDARFIQLKG